MTDLTRLSIVRSVQFRLFKCGFRARMEKLEQRMLFTGALDPSFGTGGFVITDLFANKEEFAQTILAEPSGSVLAIGATMGGEYNFAVRSNPDGIFDHAFGQNGVVSNASPERGSDYTTTAILDAQGRVLVGGFVDKPDDDVLYSSLRRYNADGTLDTTFADHGQLIFTFAPEGKFNRGLGNILLDRDGSILVTSGGAYRESDPNRFYFAKLDANDAFDRSFGDNGIQQVNVPVDGAFYGQASFDHLDRILMSGGTMAANESGLLLDQSVMVRFNTDGSFDDTFGDHGVVRGVLPGESNSLGKARLDTQGRILVNGFTREFSGTATGLSDLTDQTVILCLRDDGTVDPTFGENGRINFAPGKANVAEYITGFEVLPDGDIVAGINVNQNDSTQDIVRDFAIRRFNSDGSLDATFGTNGTLTTDFGSALDTIAGMTLDAKSRLVVTGYTSIGDDPSTLEAEGETALVVARFDLGDFPNIDPMVGGTVIMMAPVGGVPAPVAAPVKFTGHFASQAIFGETDDSTVITDDSGLAG